jgi:hypothetical protein
LPHHLLHFADHRNCADAGDDQRGNPLITAGPNSAKVRSTIIASTTSARSLVEDIRILNHPSGFER